MIEFRPALGMSLRRLAAFALALLEDSAMALIAFGLFWATGQVLGRLSPVLPYTDFRLDELFDFLGKVSVMVILSLRIGARTLRSALDIVRNR